MRKKTRNTFYYLLPLTLWAVPLLSFAQTQQELGENRPYRMMDGWGNMMGSGGMHWGAFWGGMLIPLIWLLFILGIIILVIYLVTKKPTSDSLPEASDKVEYRTETPPEKPKKVDKDSPSVIILKERYAKGEISSKEFEERIEKLSQY